MRTLFAYRPTIHLHNQTLNKGILLTLRHVASSTYDNINPTLNGIITLNSMDVFYGRCNHDSACCIRHYQHLTIKLHSNQSRLPFLNSVSCIFRHINCRVFNVLYIIIFNSPTDTHSSITILRSKFSILWSKT